VLWKIGFAAILADSGGGGAAWLYEVAGVAGTDAGAGAGAAAGALDGVLDAAFSPDAGGAFVSAGAVSEAGAELLLA